MQYKLDCAIYDLHYFLSVPETPEENPPFSILILWFETIVIS